MADNQRTVVPPVLYLPVQEHAELERVAALRTLADGRTALIAFTALDRLGDACGPNQPWVLVFLSELDEIRARTPFDVVAFDPEVPASAVRDGQLI